MIVLAGSEDLALGMTPTEIADNLVMMGDVAKAHAVHPIFASLLPASGDAAQRSARPSAIQKVNNWIRDYCIRENLYIRGLLHSHGGSRERNDEGRPLG